MNEPWLDEREPEDFFDKVDRLYDEMKDEQAIEHFRRIEQAKNLEYLKANDDLEKGRAE